MCVVELRLCHLLRFLLCCVRVSVRLFAKKKYAAASARGALWTSPSGVILGSYFVGPRLDFDNLDDEPLNSHVIYRFALTVFIFEHLNL